MNSIELSKHLDQLLDPEKISDVSCNGLQIPSEISISKIAVATDASMEVFEEAKAKGCNFIFVHHGIFWNFNKESNISLKQKEKLRFLFDNEISLYASHLPLDIHPIYGNNKSLFDLLKLQKLEKMGNFHGLQLGLMGDLENSMSFENFTQFVEQQLNDKVKAYLFNDQDVQKVALITGQGQDGLFEAQEKGFDTFITGEMNHYMYHVAKESNINLILAGHYRTETLGPKAIGQYLNKKFSFDIEFLEFPTGL
ncbi:MAG: Nif3-like dinuclear metal center hexameric protein [Candidatus Cloacimonadota bacterium]|nr:MAG: Nif3-like dinuclear metal center hexameric protein [Candidatus Cloacimonadota bacterium]